MVSDGHRPHRYPKDAPDDVLAWACAACGEVIPEYGPLKSTECPVDWRAKRYAEESTRASARLAGREVSEGFVRSPQAAQFLARRTRRCVRCGYTEAEHPDDVTPAEALAVGGPCHRYEKPAPLWMRIVNR